MRIEVDQASFEAYKFPSLNLSPPDTMDGLVIVRAIANRYTDADIPDDDDDLNNMTYRHIQDCPRFLLLFTLTLF